jgi:hypothetical protein
MVLAWVAHQKIIDSKNKIKEKVKKKKKRERVIKHGL